MPNLGLLTSRSSRGPTLPNWVRWAYERDAGTGHTAPPSRYCGEVTAREEVLRTARHLASGARDGTFTIEQVVRALARAGSGYQESTIRTHVASVMCANAPNNHQTRYLDFVRVDHGRFRLNEIP